MESQSRTTVENGLSPLWKIVTVASIGTGVQFGWALQLSLLTPYVQTLGVPHSLASLIWLCGPISGFIIQPTVGFYSDRCTSRFGRRRPFISVGTAFIIVAVFLIAFARDIGFHAGDPIDKPTKPRAIAVFVVGFWCLDVANNMLQGPCRVLLADLSAGDDKRMRTAYGWFAFFLAVGNVLGYAAGSYSHIHKLLPFSRTDVCDVDCANLKTCFLIDICLLLLITLTAVSTVIETPLTKEVTDGSGGNNKSSMFLWEITLVVKNMKKPEWTLLLVTCLNWIALFPFMLFDTDWMGREVYGGEVNGAGKEGELYSDGVRAGALGLMINSVVLGLSSLALEPVGRIIGGVKNLWGIANFILCICFLLMVLITKMAEHWRAGNAPHLASPPLHIKGSALAVFAVLGTSIAVTFTIPWALASMYCSASGGGQGLSLGVLNLSVVIPQLFVSLISGTLDEAFGGGNVPAFVLGAAAAIVSGLLAIFVLPEPPKQVSTDVSAEMVGSH